jgi:phosphatidylglycerophosphatase C
MIDGAGCERPGGDRPSVVIFDFDGTLVRTDSFLDFSTRYCAARPGRLLMVGAMLPLAMLGALHSRETAGSMLLWAMTVGCPTRRFAMALARYARQALLDHANEAVFAELTRHLERGDRVIIATGTMPIIVRGLLRARRLERVPVVGSRLRRRWGGLVAETHCTGKTKVTELRRRLGIVEWSSVYTDSYADRGLLIGASDVTLVGPSARTLRHTRRSLDGTVPLRVMSRTGTTTT